jgi:hypothetical protein
MNISLLVPEYQGSMQPLDAFVHCLGESMTFVDTYYYRYTDFTEF